jgi:hypothetical protein
VRESTMKEPSPLVLFATVAVLFLGGAVAGISLAGTFAPGSWVAMGVGFFALPLAFASGLQAWMGLALGLGLVRLVRGRRARSGAATVGKDRLPGGFVFVPFSSAAGLVAGIMSGICSAIHGVVLVTLIYWTVGTLHGLAAWAAVRAGWLMPPEQV